MNERELRYRSGKRTKTSSDVESSLGAKSGSREIFWASKPFVFVMGYLGIRDVLELRLTCKKLEARVWFYMTNRYYFRVTPDSFEVLANKLVKPRLLVCGADFSRVLAELGAEKAVVVDRGVERFLERREAEDSRALVSYDMVKLDIGFVTVETWDSIVGHLTESGDRMTKLKSISLSYAVCPDDNMYLYYSLMLRRKDIVRVLPLTVTNFVLGPCYSDCLDLLPSWLTYLKMHVRDTGTIVRNLPPNLETLYLKVEGFDTRIENLPSGLKHLVLRGYFWQALTFLPNGLVSLASRNVTMNLKNELEGLPPSLKKLKLLGITNADVSFLPEGVERLHLGKMFMRDLDRLPTSLKHLKLEAWRGQPLNELPKGLKTLTIKSTFINGQRVRDYVLSNADVFYSTIANNLPPSLEKLTMDGILPYDIFLTGQNSEQLTFGLSAKKNRLTFRNSKLATASFSQGVPCDVQRFLPSSLTYLRLEFAYSSASLDRFPPNLTTLALTGTFNQPLKNLPATLVTLELGDEFNQPLDDLPEGVKDIRLGAAFDHDIDKIPRYILYLKVHDRYRAEDRGLPPGMTLTHCDRPFYKVYERV